MQVRCACMRATPTQYLDRSNQQKFSLRNSHFIPKRESFLPQKFSAIRYIPTVQVFKIICVDKNFVCFIFVQKLAYENFSTWKISQFTICDKIIMLKCAKFHLVQKSIFKYILKEE